MKTAAFSTRRGGFSLIELLVVIAIIAVLAAIAGAVFSKIRGGAARDGSVATVRKLASLLDNRWRQVLDSSKNPPANVLTYCKGDKERALALWAMINLRSEFPQTFAEAHAPVFGLPPKQIYLNVAKLPTTADAREQSAALLHAILTQSGKSGLGLEGLNQQVTTTKNGLQVFVDTYGTPIAFERFGMCPELDADPYHKPNMVKLPGGTAFDQKNTLDPLGKLLTMPTNATWLTDASLSPTPAALASVLFPGLTEFPNRNVMPVIVSAGPDKNFGSFYVNPSNQLDAANDNIMSFRVRREGDSGE